MSTRGFIGLVHNGQTTITYNHSDSYPTWLGCKVAKFIQGADLERIAALLPGLVQVDEIDKPSPEQLADLKARGFWQDVSTGDDWYAALRSAQGDILAYLEAGYIPSMSPEVIQKSDIFIEWGYLIDLDERVLRIYSGAKEGEPMHDLGATGLDLLGDMGDEEIRETMTHIERTAP